MDKLVNNKYEIKEQLGSGSFGEALLVYDHSKSRELKVLKKASIKHLKPKEIVETVNEAIILMQLDHPFIVKYYDSFTENDCFYIVQEYCEGGDLWTKLQENKKIGKMLSEKEVLFWYSQLVLAFDYLHSKNILHRDIKTRNVFLKNNKLKVGDFGLAKTVSNSSYAYTVAGTTPYFSPEICKNIGYNSKSDIWSLGVLLYELCTYKLPFDSFEAILNMEPPNLPNSYSKNLNSLMKKILEKKTELRFSIVEIKSYLFENFKIIFDKYDFKLDEKVGFESREGSFCSISKVPLPPRPVMGSAKIVTKKSCFMCNKDIDSSLDKFWTLSLDDDLYFHDKCQNCKTCNKKLGSTVLFKEYGLYCLNCFQKNFCKKCCFCNKYVSDVYLYIKPEYSSPINESQIWHPECFKCSMCENSLENKKVYSNAENQNKFYCYDCYLKRYIKKCYICHDPILETKMYKLKDEVDMYYHENCRKCASCKSHLPSKFKIKDKKMYCPECYQTLFTPKCHSCHKFMINDEYYYVTDERRLNDKNYRMWHKSCFNCIKCGLCLVENKLFKNQMGEIMCFDCRKACK